MNNNPEMASTWKGRVLFQVSAEKVDKAIAKTCGIDEDTLAAAEDAMLFKEYAIIAQVGQAIGLPTSNKYNIKITVGGFEMLFEPFAQKESLKYKRYGRSPNEAEIKTHCDCLKRDIDECPKGHKMKL